MFSYFVFRKKVLIRLNKSIGKHLASYLFQAFIFLLMVKKQTGESIFSLYQCDKLPEKEHSGQNSITLLCKTMNIIFFHENVWIT